MAIKIALLNNGVINYGYSAAVIGVGEAGRIALRNLNLPRYDEENCSFFRTIYLNDDHFIRNPELNTDMDDYEGVELPSTREKDDPLDPCKSSNWLFVVGDMNESDAMDTTLKCARAHAEHHDENSFSICVTYKACEPLSPSLAELFDLIIYTDDKADLLRRPVELILSDMTGGLIPLIDFSDTENILKACKVMYFENEYYTDHSDENLEKIIQQMESKIHFSTTNGECIHALVSAKSGDDRFSCQRASIMAVNMIWKQNGVAICQAKSFTKEKASSLSVLYGFGHSDEVSLFQAMNRWSAEIPEGQVLEL